MAIFGAIRNLIVNLQSDTTNTVPINIVQCGWGVITIASPTTSYSEAVTFPQAFSAAPIVVAINGGDNLTAGGAAYGNGGNTVSGTWQTKAYGITTSGFTIKMDAAGVGAGGFVYYQWIAVGAP